MKNVRASTSNIYTFFAQNETTKNYKNLFKRNF